MKINTYNFDNDEIDTNLAEFDEDSAFCDDDFSLENFISDFNLENDNNTTTVLNVERAGHMALCEKYLKKMFDDAEIKSYYTFNNNESSNIITGKSGVIEMRLKSAYFNNYRRMMLYYIVGLCHCDLDIGVANDNRLIFVFGFSNVGIEVGRHE